MELEVLKSVCQKLSTQEYVEKKLTPPPKVNKINADLDTKDEHIIIQRIDFENLINFVKLYTNIIEVENAIDQYRMSNFESLQEFEQENYLYNLGFFYIQVDHQCPIAEYLSLLNKIPFEQFCMPGTNQISFITLTELFGIDCKDLIMQLMVLGDYFKYWELINPYSKMKSTNCNTKLLLSAMGSLAILITPGFLNSCIELIQSFNVINTKQTQSGQFLLY